MNIPIHQMPSLLNRRRPTLLKSFMDLDTDMDQWIQTAASQWPQVADELGFTPTSSLRETNRAFVVQVDLPGVKKEDVKITIENSRLTVSGERRFSKEEKDDRRFLSESYFGTFMRSFHLPANVDENKVNAEFSDGVLTVQMPKMQPSKAKEVRIN